MPRNARQSMLIDIISNNEIETQEELVNALCDSGFEVTQATISRDIKELGLIKIVGNSKKYKYAIVGGDERIDAAKIANIFKEAVFWVKEAGNLVVVKTLKGTAPAISNYIEKLSLDHALGCVYGDDTVMLISDDITKVNCMANKLKEILGVK